MPNSMVSALVAGNVLLALALMWTSAQSQTQPVVADVLRAHSIELINPAGAVVAQLFAGEDGGGQLRFRNGSGEVRIKLGVLNDGTGASLIMMDAATDPAVQLRAGGDGTTLLLDNVRIGGG